MSLFARCVELPTQALGGVLRFLGSIGGPALRLWRLASLRAHVRCEVPATTQFDGAVLARGTGMLRFGAACRLGRGAEFDTSASGTIDIGECVRINTGTVIVANSHVTIGSETLIGEYVSIRDANHGTQAGVAMRTQPQDVEGIVIGRDVWVGRGCCILKGVRIGDGAVIGANSVVTSDVPAGTIFAGAPARQIGRRGGGASDEKS